MFSTYLADPDILRHCGPEAIIRNMLAFEGALATVQGQLGIIPSAAASTIADTVTRLTITPESLTAGTLQNGVPTLPLLAQVREALPESVRGELHVGATSQDVLDTAQVLAIRSVMPVLADRINEVLASLNQLTLHYGNVPMMGRTRTQQAQPITFGQKVLSWRNPLVRHLERLDQLKPRVLVVQLGGAVGNLAAFGEKGEAVARALAAELNLNYATPWHTERDGLAEFTNWLALLTGTLGKLGQDILLMGQTEVGEVVENVNGGGKSSAMPHKNNPVLSEALVMLARQNAQFAAIQLQSMVHGNERDATAWMLEWDNLPRMMSNAGTSLRHALSITQTMGVKGFRT
ncbi:lyase family protein [Fibrella forsythiae]|uniref:3-carboxy-cis,cis-muconate cycloisomerase n=1 Tax=Fibrella forsythiae TaxID=2817061 RepID=A0ABS3JPL1_9BACT|nr:lyase family protein [Fibrella forsythiae]MBO0951936.1 3-carboxy-cis,cis-muconate cycloisomerase [Fibrella forsythiae]